MFFHYNLNLQYKSVASASATSELIILVAAVRKSMITRLNFPELEDDELEGDSREFQVASCHDCGSLAALDLDVQL